MTNEQITEIKKKIERATEIVATLKKLENADPFKSGRIARFFDGSTQSAVLDDELLKRVIFYGIDFMTSMLSTELASIEPAKQAANIEPAKQAANSKKCPSELTRLASPLIDHIRLNHDPHTRILIDWSSAEVIQSTCRVIAPE